MPHYLLLALGYSQEKQGGKNCRGVKNHPGLKSYFKGGTIQGLQSSKWPHLFFDGPRRYRRMSQWRSCGIFPIVVDVVLLD